MATRPPSPTVSTASRRPKRSRARSSPRPAQSVSNRPRRAEGRHPVMPNDARRLSVGAAFAFLMVGLAIIGTFRAYSPVPYMDMWDAYVNFFIQVQDGGGLHPWWLPHNEHRLVLTRLFCWSDLAWLDGAGWPML